MLNGYLALGGAQLPAPLPCFEASVKGNHIGSRNRGHWVFDTYFQKTVLNIPSRDKQVESFTSTDCSLFSERLSGLDSENEHLTYKGKLNLILPELSPNFIGIVNNISTSTHGSLALVCRDAGLHFYGLFDTELDYTYLMWTSEAGFLAEVLESKPLRYLVYRMPILTNNSVFLPGEIICSKWWRLTKNHSQVLYALNALERRLFGPASV
jgi:hypothetical protein